MSTSKLNYNPLTIYIGYIPKIGRNEETMELILKDIFNKLFIATISPSKINSINHNQEACTVHNLLNGGPFTDSTIKYNKTSIINSIDLIEKIDQFSHKPFWMGFVHFNISLVDLIQDLEGFIQKINSLINSSNNYDYYSTQINHYQDTLKLFNNLQLNKESTIYYSQIPPGKGYLEHVGNVHYNCWFNTEKHNRKFIKIKIHQSIDQLKSYSNINNVHMLTNEEAEMLDDLIFDSIKDELELEYLDMEIEDDWLHTALSNQYSDMFKDLEACERARSIFYYWTENIRNSTLNNDKNISWYTKESFYNNSYHNYYNLDDMMYIMSNIRNHVMTTTHNRNQSNLKWESDKKLSHNTLLINPDSQLSIIPGMAERYLKNN